MYIPYHIKSAILNAVFFSYINSHILERYFDYDLNKTEIVEKYAIKIYIIDMLVNFILVIMISTILFATMFNFPGLTVFLALLNGFYYKEVAGYIMSKIMDKMIK